MPLNEYLYNIGEAIFMELEEVVTIAYPHEGENWLTLILSNGARIKLEMTVAASQAA